MTVQPPFEQAHPLHVAPLLRQLQQDGVVHRVRTTTGDQAWLVTGYDSNREHKARRPTGPLTSIRRLTHALAAAAGMTRNGDPSTRLGYGLERAKVNR